MVDIQKARLEIEGRTRLRLAANLPSIAVVAELLRMYQVQRENDFEQFFLTSPLGKRVEQKLLDRESRLRGNP
jgi:hypothetical protein